MKSRFEGMTDAEIRYDSHMQEEYGDLLAWFPDHPVKYYNGAVRWVHSPLMRWISDQAILNDMCVAAQQEVFGLDEYMKFYRDIGYSLSGFVEVFGETLWPREDDAE